MAVAEVADEQITAEPTEVGRRPGEAPRRIELTVTRDARQERAIGREGIDEAAASSGLLVVTARLGLRVRHEHHAVEGLDPERGVAHRQSSDP